MKQTIRKFQSIEIEKGGELCRAAPTKDGALYVYCHKKPDRKCSHFCAWFDEPKIVEQNGKKVVRIALCDGLVYETNLKNFTDGRVAGNRAV